MNKNDANSIIEKYLEKSGWILIRDHHSELCEVIGRPLRDFYRAISPRCRRFSALLLLLKESNSVLEPIVN